MTATILEIINQCFASIPSHDPRATTTPFHFVTALIFSLVNDRGQKTLASLRRSIIGHTNTQMSRGTFWERMATKRLVDILTFLVTTLMARFAIQVGVAIPLLEQLGVTAIYLLDSSSVSLPEGAAKNYPAPRKNVVPASVKWHFLFNVLDGNMSWFDITPATTHDRKGFPPLETLIKGTLIIFDLGYWDYLLLKDLMDRGVFFLCRVKSNSRIRIVQVISGLPKVDYKNRFILQCRLPHKKSKIIEVLGELQHKGQAILQTRVIGFWNPAEKAYHWYITSLPEAAHLMYPLYRLRWQIELAFKTCKSCFSLADITTANKKIIQSLMLIGMIVSLVSAVLGTAIAEELPDEKKRAKSLQRAGMILVRISQLLIHYIFENSKETLDALLNKIQLYKHELFDPNYRSRPTSLERVWRQAHV